MRDQPNLGGQELALLRFVGERQPVSARDVVAEFGEANGLARTTVLTMLERLRTKRVIRRAKKGGLFVYSLAEDQKDVLHGVVESFVEKALGGSVVPFVAYLTQSRKLKKEEIEALRNFVDEMGQEDGDES
ncbi:MAG TPA: BlaI/MecI/CopY family transcriptional regulator [Fimbriimonas sp.]|nr:BlaI/MecI/CopY family transcriptional regulator [Fimbriimonas sp.]